MKISLFLKLYLLKLIDFFITNRLCYSIHKLFSWMYFQWMRWMWRIEFHNGTLSINNKVYIQIDTFKKIREKSKLFKDLDIVFICDGNRRWATKNNIDNNQTKIQYGIEKIEQIIEFSYLHGLRSVSFYIFSIRNFQRDSAEIMAIKKFITNGKIQNYPFQLKLYGDFSYFEDATIIEKLLEIEEKSDSRNNSFIVNIFISYNSTNCDKDKTNKRQFFNDNVDLVIRTSGEKRLSDFMIRQVASGCGVNFVNCLWPELTLSHITFMLLLYKIEMQFFRKKSHK